MPNFFDTSKPISDFLQFPHNNIECSIDYDKNSVPCRHDGVLGLRRWGGEGAWGPCLSPDNTSGPVHTQIATRPELGRITLKTDLFWIDWEPIMVDYLTEKDGRGWQRKEGGDEDQVPRERDDEPDSRCILLNDFSSMYMIRGWRGIFQKA